MKQRFISSKELDDAVAAAKANAVSRIVKFLKPINTTTTNTKSHHPLFFRFAKPSTNQENQFNMSSSSSSSSSSISRRRTELPNQEDDEAKYPCITCGRKFKTFQALGGHRASHKMKLVGSGIGEDGEYQNYHYREKLHECSICGKGYQTGQALGGHMRKHRELLENQRTAADNANRDQYNGYGFDLRWAQMNAAAIVQYSNLAQAQAQAVAPPQPQAGAPLQPEAPPEEREDVQSGREQQSGRGLKIDLNLDLLENKELGFVIDEW